MRDKFDQITQRALPKIPDIQTLKSYPKNPNKKIINSNEDFPPQNDIIIKEMISASTDGMRIWNNKLACETYIEEDAGYQKLLSTNDYIIATKTNGYIDTYKNSPPHNKIFTLFGHKGSINAICRIHKMGEGNTEITKSNLVATGGEDATILVDCFFNFSLIWLELFISPILCRVVTNSLFILL